MSTLPKGIKVGHANDEHTGVTVILCEKGAVGGCDVRGGAPGTRETDLLKSEKMMDEVHAVALCGGSAYGLEAACGVMDYLREKGIGYKIAGKVVPIVPAAVIYDLNGADYHWADKKMGYNAAFSAMATPSFGQVGVGTGATVGKIRGFKSASKGGVGVGGVKIMGINITAVVAVNAFGDVVDPATGAVLAGARGRNGFINTEKMVLDGSLLKLLLGANTTIGCILTDTKLSKIEANKLAAAGHNGLARVIRPVHTDYDGDTLFCLATGKKKALNFMMLQVGAAEAVARAVVNAVSGGGFVSADIDEEGEGQGS
ncbi:MAG: P1 family peptidase [Firmicutes bacterium]|nr:P1 family peptidase [Bacillota bacterium]